MLGRGVTYYNSWC